MCLDVAALLMLRMSPAALPAFARTCSAAWRVCRDPVWVTRYVRLRGIKFLSLHVEFVKLRMRAPLPAHSTWLACIAERSGPRAPLCVHDQRDLDRVERRAAKKVRLK